MCCTSPRARSDLVKGEIQLQTPQPEEDAAAEAQRIILEKYTFSNALALSGERPTTHLPHEWWR